MAPLEEYQHIEIVIELDKGRSIAEVAEQFGVSLRYVRKLAIASQLLLPPTWPSPKKHQLREEDTQLIIERIEQGELLEEIALEWKVSVQTLRKLCEREGVTIPKALHHLKKSELQEIQEWLAADEPIVEIARTYNLAYATVEQIQQEYRKLDHTILGCLYEIITENPQAPPAILKRFAKQKGLELNENAILSYQNRLRELGYLD